MESSAVRAEALGWRADEGLGDQGDAAMSVKDSVRQGEVTG